MTAPEPMAASAAPHLWRRRRPTVTLAPVHGADKPIPNLGVQMTSSPTELEKATVAYADAVEAFRSANAEYLNSISDANAQITELNRLDAAIRAGDASVAGERLKVKALVADLTAVAEARDQAVRVAIRRRDAAYADVVAEKVRASAGAMKTSATFRTLELEAQQAIDKVLFELADAVGAHNKEVAATANALISAQGVENRHLAVEARNDSSGTAVIVDGVEYRETTPSLVVGNAVGHPVDRWKEDRHADELASRRAKRDLEVAERKRESEERFEAQGAAHSAEAKASKRAKPLGLHSGQ